MSIQKMNMQVKETRIYRITLSKISDTNTFLLNAKKNSLLIIKSHVAGVNTAQFSSSKNVWEGGNNPVTKETLVATC